MSEVTRVLDRAHRGDAAAAEELLPLVYGELRKLAAAEAMRRILIDRARSRRAERDGGRLQRLTLDELDLPAQAGDDVLLSVHEALEALGDSGRRFARLFARR